jgi:UDP-glucose 4-epimerase
MTGRTAAFNRERLLEFTSPNWRCDSSALRQATGFLPRFTLDSGLEQTLNWYKAEGLL